MVEGKFKRGNLVRFIREKEESSYMSERGVEIVEVDNPYYNKLAIIEEYSNPQGNMKEYSICFLDGSNSIAWIDEKELEFVEEGGEYLFEEYEKNRKALEEGYKDLNYIKKHLDKPNTVSILYLFDLIGYYSSFNRNGEFFILDRDWHNLSGIFKFMFGGDKDNMIKEVCRVFKEQYRQKYIDSCLKLFAKVNALQ